MLVNPIKLRQMLVDPIKLNGPPMNCYIWESGHACFAKKCV